MKNAGDRRSLWIVCTSVAFSFAARSMLAPLAPLFALELGASVGVVGLLVAAAYLLPLFLAMPVGSYVDRRGPRKLITTGAAMMTLAPFLIVISPSLTTLAGVQALVGLAHLLIGLSNQSFVAGLGKADDRERNFGWYSTFASAGQLVGPLVAGLIADALGFTTAFAVAGGLALVGMVLSRLLPPSRASEDTILGLGANLMRVGELLNRPGIRLGILASASGMFVMTAFQAFLPAYLEGLNYSATAIGGLLSLKSLASMIVRPFMPKIVGLLGGRLRTLFAMMLLIGAMIGVTGFVSTTGLLMLVAIGFGVGFGVSQPVSMVTVLQDADRGSRGFVLGLRLTGNRISQLLGPLVLGIVAESFGFSSAFLSGTVIVVLGSVFVINMSDATDTDVDVS